MLHQAALALALALLAATIDWGGVHMRCTVRLPLGTPPPPAIPRLTAPDRAALAASRLRTATTAWVPDIVGAESFAFDDAGTLYTGSVNGTVWAAAPGKDAVPRALAHTGGRPVGLAWDGRHGRLLVACSVKGLLGVDVRTGRVSLLASHAREGAGGPGTTPGGLVTFANSVVALPPHVGGAGHAGGALFTTSLDTPPPPPSRPGAAWQPAQAATAALFSGVPTGRVLRYDEASGVTTTVAAGLWFANGLALLPGGRAAVVAETMAGRLVRVDLGSGAVAPFAALPGFPDGVAPAGRRGRGRGGRGGGGLDGDGDDGGAPTTDSVWVAIVEAPGPPATFLASSRVARWLAARLPVEVATRATPPVGMVVRVSTVDGSILETLADKGGRVVRGVTSAVEDGGRLWLGSLVHVGVQSIAL